MEEYKFGDWVSGYKHSQNISVTVQQKTTTTTQQTSPSSKLITTPILHTTTKIHTQVEDIEGKIADDKSSHDSIEHDDNIEHDDSIADDDKEINQDKVYDDEIKALPIEDREVAEVTSKSI